MELIAMLSASRSSREARGDGCNAQSAVLFGYFDPVDIIVYDNSK